MPVHGTLKADGIAVCRIEIDYLTNPVKIKALAGFTVEATGQTVGWVDAGANAWSEATLQKLRELRQLMEEDLARALFVGGGSGSEVTSRSNGLIPSGLGEHLGDKTPSV